MIEKIRISNEKLWDITQSGQDIDSWLKEHVGFGNYTEWYSNIVNLPYRSFSFKEEKDKLLFVLTWT